MRTIQIAGLNVAIRGKWSGTHARSLVILLHGYGAPGTDLVSLADEIAAPPETLMLFPAAPIELAFQGSDANTGRAWWPIDMVQLQVAMMTGQFDNVVHHLRPGLGDAIACISRLVATASEQFGVGLDRIILGGFSQGAILSLEASLQNRWKLAGLLLFSASLLDARDVVERAHELAPIPCVLSHGQMDPILPFARADQLRLALVDAGWQVDWQPFLGGHGIPPAAIAAAAKLVAHQLV